jgi:hypothetical protein
MKSNKPSREEQFKMLGVSNEIPKLMAQLEAKRKADEDRKRLVIFFAIVFGALLLMKAFGAVFA